MVLGPAAPRFPVAGGRATGTPQLSSREKQTAVGLREHTRRRLRSLHQQDRAGELTMATTTDYDAPRGPVIDLEEDSLEELKSRRTAAQSACRRSWMRLKRRKVSTCRGPTSRMRRSP